MSNKNALRPCCTDGTCPSCLLALADVIENAGPEAFHPDAVAHRRAFVLTLREMAGHTLDAEEKAEVNLLRHFCYAARRPRQ